MDPDNIFQIIMGSQQPADQSNVLQSIAPPTDPYYSPQPVAPVAAPAPPIVAAADAASPPMPKKRPSLIDIIGRLSDTVATIGGSAPMYQPTLDARQDRELALGDHARKVDADTIKIATDKFDLGDKHVIRLGQTARGAKAILAANPSADPLAVWTAVAQRMELPPEQTQAIGQQIAQNPALLDGIIAGATDPKFQQNKYSGAVTMAIGPDGKVHAFQPSLNGEDARDILPEGYTALDPIQFANLGGTTVGVGKNTGTVKNVLPNTEKPGMRGGVPINERPGYRGGRPIAPPPPKEGAGKGNPRDALAYLDNISSGFEELHRLGGLAGDTSGVGAVEGALGRTAIGQKLGEQFNNPAAQKRLELIKNINSLQSEMIQSLPGSATRTKFEQEIQKARLPDPMKMSYSTAKTVIKQLRDQYSRALEDLKKEKPAASTARPSIIRPKAQSGWTIVGVK